MNELYFEAYGDPKPQGSKRHVGNGIMVEASNVKPWRKTIAKAVEATWAATGEKTMFSEPVVVWVVFYITRPKSVKRPFPSVAPDLDKLQRSLGDAVSIDCQALADDSLIIRWIASKRYADFRAAGCDVLIRSARHYGEPIPNALQGLDA
jgi:crossover junction endodeoxyribonuclease RusA